MCIIGSVLFGYIIFVLTEKHWRGSKEPVVILLGWAGSRDKHLAKYSSIYNEQVRHCPKVFENTHMLVFLQWWALLALWTFRKKKRKKKLSLGSLIILLAYAFFFFFTRNFPSHEHFHYNAIFTTCDIMYSVLYNSRRHNILCIMKTHIPSYQSNINYIFTIINGKWCTIKNFFFFL